MVLWSVVYGPTLALWTEEGSGEVAAVYPVDDGAFDQGRYLGTSVTEESDAYGVFLHMDPRRIPAPFAEGLLEIYRRAYLFILMI